MSGFATPAPLLSVINVLIVDDSALIRRLLAKALEGQSDIKVVGMASNGQEAIDIASRGGIDVIVLDIEMPVMDGITALPKLLAATKRTKILMASTLTLQNAEISLRAMSLGASDYIPKPTASELGGAADFGRELVAKVRALGTVARKALKGTATKPATAAAIRLRKRSMVPPRVIAIGSSTGGPQALAAVLSGLPASVQQPILVTQHMPPTFTTILADHLGKSAKRPSAEAKEGMLVEPGHIYVAPGGYHMTVSADGILHLNTNPPENYVRPAVDPMLRSIASVYGAASICAILTGMGADGARGAQAIADAGGTVVAQDEKSSVVWGMPGATAAAGVCAAVLPITEIAPFIVRAAAGLPA